MSERHSSSQIPLPPQLRASPFSERRRKPFPEGVMGLPVYGDMRGKDSP